MTQVRPRGTVGRITDYNARRRPVATRPHARTSLAERLQPGDQRLGGLIGADQAAVRVDVRRRVAGLEPGDGADERLGDGQGDPPRPPVRLDRLVRRAGPLRGLDADARLGVRVGAVARGHDHARGGAGRSAASRGPAAWRTRTGRGGGSPARSTRARSRSRSRRSPGRPGAGSRRGAAARAGSGWCPSIRPRAGRRRSSAGPTGSAWRATCTARAAIRTCSSSERPRISPLAARCTTCQSGIFPW